MLLDIDADGICDGIDDCVGEIDVCGVCVGDGILKAFATATGVARRLVFFNCSLVTTRPTRRACDCDGNGPDDIYDCGCSGIPEGECDCDGNVLDECGVCGFAGIPEGPCDCDGNGPDDIYDCGCSGIPEGECDCDGNVLDELGMCGGDCI